MQPAQPGAHSRKLAVRAPAAEAIKREWDQVHAPTQAPFDDRAAGGQLDCHGNGQQHYC